MTESIGELATALAQVQAELPKLERDRTVEVQQKSGAKYSYSYVTLAALNDAVLPLLSKHGLAFVTMPGTGTDGKMCVRYSLLHKTGDRLDGEFPISGEGGIQMVGGRITYARRYVLAALVGVAADEDDESRLTGEATSGTAQRAARPRPAATGRTAARKTAVPASEPPLPGDDDGTMTDRDRKTMHALFGKLGVTDRAERLDYVAVAVGRQVGSSNDLTRAETATLIDRLKIDVAAKEAETADPADDADAWTGQEPPPGGDEP